MSLKQIVSFAFVASIALTLLLLSCTLKINENTKEDVTHNAYGLFGTLDLPYTFVLYEEAWKNPKIVIIFYVLAPLPLLIARNMEHGLEMAVFWSIGFVISSFALPAVLANRNIIEVLITVAISKTKFKCKKWGACGLTMAASVVMFATIIGMMRFDDDFFGYNQYSF